MPRNNATPAIETGPDWARFADRPVGEILRLGREHYGLRLEEVSGALRIRSSQLAALEEGDTEKLPGRVYAIGFVRAYAEFLGLDGDQMVYLFKTQMIDNKARPELNFPVPASESKLPNKYVLAGSFGGLVVLAVLAAVLAGVSGSRDIPPVSSSMKVADASVYGPIRPAGLAAIDPAAGMMGPTIPENRIVINVTDNAWVEIRNAKGKALISRILKKGDSYMVPNEKGLVMDTGNIGLLELTVDGRPLAGLGEFGDVRRAVPLDPEKLKAEYGTVTPAAVNPAAVKPPVKAQPAVAVSTTGGSAAATAQQNPVVKKPPMPKAQPDARAVQKAQKKIPNSANYSGYRE